MAKITFVFDDGQDVVVPLQERITVGRAEDNDVVVEDERISKYHAELLTNADGSVQVFDQQSTAGTFVNDERVTSRTLLHGDRLAFGPLKAVLDMELPPAAAISKKTVKEPVAAAAQEREANEAVRKAKNRLALLEAAEKQAEAAQREWKESFANLQREHAEQTAELERLNAQTEKAKSRLQSLETNEKRLLELAETARRETAEIESHAKEIKQAIAVHAEQILAAEAKNAELQARKAELETQVAEAEKVQERLTQARTACVESEARQSALQVALLRLEQDRGGQEKSLSGLESKIAEVEIQLAAARKSLEDENRHVDKARLILAEIQAQHKAPLENLDAEIAEAQMELGQLRAELRPLRNWKQDMSLRVSRMAKLPPGSADSQELKAEIESEMNALLHLIATPPSQQSYAVQVELMRVSSVPMKSVSVRLPQE